jgi:hypothetical protein
MQDLLLLLLHFISLLVRVVLFTERSSQGSRVVMLMHCRVLRAAATCMEIMACVLRLTREEKDMLVIPSGYYNA